MPQPIMLTQREYVEALRREIMRLAETMDKVVARHHIEAEDDGDSTIDVCTICREEYPCLTVELLTS